MSTKEISTYTRIIYKIELSVNADLPLSYYQV